MTSYRDWLYNQLGGNPSGGSSSGGGLEDVIVCEDGGMTGNVIDKVEGGKRYLVRGALPNQPPIAELTILEVENTSQEIQIWFFTEFKPVVTLPASVGWVGEPTFGNNKYYIVSIQNNVAVAAEYTPGAKV